MAITLKRRWLCCVLVERHVRHEKTRKRQTDRLVSPQHSITIQRLRRHIHAFLQHRAVPAGCRRRSRVLYDATIPYHQCLSRGVTYRTISSQLSHDLRPTSTIPIHFVKEDEGKYINSSVDGATGNVRAEATTQLEPSATAGSDSSSIRAWNGSRGSILPSARHHSYAQC